jgi:hypothetical protein
MTEKTQVQKKIHPITTLKRNQRKIHTHTHARARVNRGEY